MAIAVDERDLPVSRGNALPRHSRQFKLRRAANWIPLGLTYAAFYMGRYNFNVVKGDLAGVYHLGKDQVGAIATAGFWTYGLAVIINGPLADRIGGRKAILAGAIGTLVMNALIGFLFLRQWTAHLVLGMSVLYAISMYFQSFGALSVVKINAAWFHRRERGVFGGIFGTMISSGYLLAMTVGGAIFAWSKGLFGEKNPISFAAVFIVPAFVIFVMYLVDLRWVKDAPQEAGHPQLDVGDAPDDGSPLDRKYVLQKILKHPVIRVIAVAEFCTGFVRQGLLLYWIEYLGEVFGAKAGSSAQQWGGLGITLGGIVGGIACGWLSDRIFQSRRPPVAFIFYVGQIVSLIVLSRVHSAGAAAFMIGFSCMWIFGVHGMLSGTASADFGGRKGAATAAGLLDGVQYIASGLTGIGLGWLLQHYKWGVWTWSLVPFSAIGAILMLTIWNAKPNGGASH